MKFHIGYEIGTGLEVNAELHHLAIFGLTQKSGKTTSLEAFINRIDGEFSVLVFRTGRGEIGFSNAARIPFYFRERTDWKFVEGLISAHLLEKAKFYRGDIMRSCQGARTLQQVWDNIRKYLELSREGSFVQKIYTELNQYLSEIVPAMKEIKFSENLQMQPGKVHVMDLEKLKRSMQQLIISASVDKILEDFRNVIVVLPEARDFIPEDRGTPTKLSVDTFIRKGAKLGDYLWIDSQALTGLDMDVMRNVGVWMFGRQDLDIEVDRCLRNIPGKTVKASDITSLGVGEFYLKQGEDVKNVYVQPSWMDDETAKAVADGNKRVEDVRKPKEGDEELEEKLKEKNETLENEIRKLEKKTGELTNLIREKDKEIEKIRLQLKERSEPNSQALLPTGIDLETREVKVNIINSEPQVRSFSTSRVNGKILYVLITDIRDHSGTIEEISSALIERGWNIKNNTLAPEIGKLVKGGTLAGEGKKPQAYKIPGKLKIDIQESD